MKINEKIMKLRKKAGLSQEELAEKLSVTRQTVSKWELGTINPKMDKIQEMSKIFNVTLEELTNEEEIIKEKEETENKVNLEKNNETKKENIRKWPIVVIIIIIIALVILLLKLIVINNIFNKGKDILNQSTKINEGIIGSFFNITAQMENQIDEGYSNETDKMQKHYENQINQIQDEFEEKENEIKEKQDEMQKQQNEMEKQNEEGYKKAIEMINKNLNK